MAERIARNLAAAFLAGVWTLDGLTRRGGRCAGAHHSSRAVLS
jgi:hypothetical protein